ncbi:hypothetical protein JHK82_027856 [Glycine max]|nr:hypothetical protein JHK82_027856 [Glycine max]
MESCVEELRRLLCLESVNDLQVIGIGIRGMGGIGKTTLAHVLYERISHQYDFHCYIVDVSKIYQDSNILGVQKQLLSNYLNGKNLEICDVYEATTVTVFDIDQVEQLNMFIGSGKTLLRQCLSGVSIIIIIYRDQHIVKTLGVSAIYLVQLLNREDSIQLFCQNDFKLNYTQSDYLVLTYGVLSHAQGNPLPIEVLRPSLFGQNFSQWGSALARLRKNNSKSIMDVLRTSFDVLDNTEKEIFLNIVCYFNNYKEQYVKKILNFHGFHLEYGLQVLIDKSLITIRERWIVMDLLLINLGRCIVQEELALGKWTRLWDYLDLYKVMFEDMPNKLVELFLPNSNIDQLWKGKKLRHIDSSIDHLRKLTFVNLKNCRKLVKLPYFGDGLNLEQLNLRGCTQLTQINSSIVLSFLMWPIHWLISSAQKDSVSCLVPSSPTFPCLH